MSTDPYRGGNAILNPSGSLDDTFTRRPSSYLTWFFMTDMPTGGAVVPRGCQWDSQRCPDVRLDHICGTGEGLWWLAATTAALPGQAIG